MWNVASRVSCVMLLVALAGCSGGDDGAGAAADGGMQDSDAATGTEGGSSTAGTTSKGNTSNAGTGSAGTEASAGTGGPIDSDGGQDAGVTADGGNVDAGSCPIGMAGPTCEDCAAGYQDGDGDGTCMPGCDATGDDAIDCGAGGTCKLVDEADGRRECTCEAGYQGELCESCSVGYEASGDTCVLDLPPTSGLYTWLDADDADSFTVTVANGVKSWADRRNAAPTSLTPSASLARPTRVANARNNRTGVRFDGSDELLAASFAGLSGKDYEIVVAADPDVDNTPSGILSFASDTSTWGVMLDQHQGNDYRITHRKTPSNAGGEVAVANRSEVLQAGWVAASHMSSSALDTLAIYAGDDATDAQAVVNIDPSAAIGNSLTLRIGRTQLGYMHGDIYEVLIYTRRLSVDERNEVVDYLTAKWDLP